MLNSHALKAKSCPMRNTISSQWRIRLLRRKHNHTNEIELDVSLAFGSVGISAVGPNQFSGTAFLEAGA